MTGDLADLSVE
jgi:hypothetical protein